MRVLILSLDRALVNKSGEGDTLKRFQVFKKYCQSLVAIVPTNKKTSEKIIKGVKIIPAFGSNNYVAYFKIYQLARKVCQQEKINLIVTNDAVLGAIAIWLRRKFPVKVQVNIFGLEILNPFWLKERPQNIFLKWIQEWVIKEADGLRTDNFGDKQLLIKQYRISPKKIVVVLVVPSLDEQKAFSLAKKDRQLKKSLVGNKKMILAVGGLVKAKDYLTLIKAMEILNQQMSKVKLIIVGEGPERSKIEKEIKKRNLKNKVKLLGSVSYQKMPVIFAIADVFVISSTHEGLPRVLMEAALCATPIVSTRVGGVKNLVKNKKSGLLVPVKDPDSLAAAIKKVLENKPEAKGMGRNARKRTQQLLKFKPAISKLIQSWQELLNEERT